MLERKVYPSYAFEENESQKSKINHEIYDELLKKWKILNVGHSEPESLDSYDLVYRRKAAYCHGEYTVLKNTTDMSADELALIFDGGNLCFGYTKEMNNFYYVFED